MTNPETPGRLCLTATDEKFFIIPMDEFFNFGKIMNIPAVIITETDKEFKLTMAITSGFEKSDFRIKSVKGIIIISAEKEVKEEKNGCHNRTRTFTLPGYVDAGHIEANYEKGELKILFPKSEVPKSKKVKMINVK